MSLEYFQQVAGKDKKTENGFVTIYHRYLHKFIRLNTPQKHLMYLIVWRLLF